MWQPAIFQPSSLRPVNVFRFSKRVVISVTLGLSYARANLTLALQCAGIGKPIVEPAGDGFLRAE